MQLTIGGIFVSSDDGPVKWTSGMECDVDGAANAYAPQGSGLPALDYWGNAYSPEESKWVGVACFDAACQHPIIQGPQDPYPGFMVAQSAMGDHAFPESDPRHWVDAYNIPYISMPPELEQFGVGLGDFAVVVAGTMTSAAIVADIGPHKKLAEGSFALHMALGYNPQRGLPKHHLVGIDRGVRFTVFAGSRKAPRWPVTLEQINEALQWL